MKFKSIFLSVLIFIYLCVAFVPCVSALEVCQKDSKQDKESDELDIDYSEYIKDPKKLGFSPNFKLFKSAYMLLKTKHMEMSDDSVLLKGCINEVNKLLKAAKSSQKFNPESLSAVESSVEAAATKTVSRDLLWFAAIEGMLQALKDPYTVLLPPKEYSTLMEQMQATSFGGIGVFIEQDKTNGNRLTVFEPIEGTPAYRAGILPEDYIVAIDGAPTKDMPIELAMGKMRGKEGSFVTLTIKRKGEPSMLSFKLKRENIKVQSVSCKLIEDKYGYIRIRTFGDNTGTEFAKAVSALENKRIKGLIIDLRNNGGGLIDAATAVGSQLIGSGNVIVSVSDRSGQKQYFRSTGNISLGKIPIVVLINKYSASASEIIAGALQDYSLATLMGGVSYGKGSVQEVIPLSNGGAFKLTVAHYFTPKNRNINKKGITPDIKFDMDVKLVGKKKGDTQLQKAVEFLRTK